VGIEINSFTYQVMPLARWILMRSKITSSKGLDLGVQYLLVAHSFDNFEQLVDKALVVENKLHEIAEKRRMTFHSQIDNSSHNYLVTQMGSHVFPKDL
jgi:hypothetical protein